MLKIVYNLANDKFKGPGFILPKIILFILSLIYGLVIRALIFFGSLHKKKFACKIISVGNITLGGTGKTPLVEYIAKELKKQGRRIVIVSRGYKRKDIHSQSIGDEPKMLGNKLSLPVIVGADRKAAITEAIKDYSVDTVILDDGFQQWGIGKDLEIVAIDANNPFGNGNMIPRGILRQPVSTLKTADVLILTKTDFAGELGRTREILSRINPRAVIALSIHSPVCFLDLSDNNKIVDFGAFRDQPAAMVCAIADPGSFRNLILKSGILIKEEFSFMDHYAYQEKDLEHIAAVLKNKNINLLVTTEKDAVKLEGKKSMSNFRVLVLRMELRITDNGQGFLDRLHKLYTL